MPPRAVNAICILHFAFCMTGCTRSAAPARRPAPNVLLITIDTLRADRVGAGITPTIDRLAASGLRFTAARAAAPLTLPSHTTLMTGLWPPAPGLPAPPFCAWIHLYDPHAPYTPPSEFLERARRVPVTSHQPPATETSLRYDGEVMYADAQLAGVVDWIGSRHLADRTLIIVAG